jgi:enhancing lycopene biosynthesis protein 2
MFGGRNSFWRKPFGTGSGSVSAFFNNSVKVLDSAGKLVTSVAAPVSGAISSIIPNPVKEVAGNLVDQAGNVISQAGKAGEKAIQDVAAETERAGESTKKLAQSANKEFNKWADVQKQFASSLGKGVEGTVGSIARGDVKGLAKSSLGTLDATKKYIIDTSKGNIKGVTDIARESGKATGNKELQNWSKNIQREYSKGADIYGPIIIDLAADYFTAGGYGLAKKSAQAVADNGWEGLVDPEVLTQAAIMAASKYAKSPDLQKYAEANKIDPKYLKYLSAENIKTAQQVAEGDAEGAIYAKAGLDPEVAKGLRKVITEGADIKEALKDVLINSLAERQGVDKQLIKSAISGDISSIAKAVASQAAGKFLPQDLGKLGKAATELIQKKPNQLASEYASSYLGIDPAVLGMANKVVKDPRGEALKALGSYSGIDPDAVQNMRSGVSALSGDLRGTAMQALGNSMGIHPQDLEIGQQIAGTSSRGAPFQALASSLGINPAYLQMGQDLYRGKTEYVPQTLGMFDDMPVSEVEDKVNEQTKEIEQKTNKIKSGKSGKKVADLFDSTPGLARQFFWNT